jgi:hypothetical protein
MKGLKHLIMGVGLSLILSCNNQKEEYGDFNLKVVNYDQSSLILESNSNKNFYVTRIKLNDSIYQISNRNCLENSFFEEIITYNRNSLKITNYEFHWLDKSKGTYNYKSSNSEEIEYHRINILNEIHLIDSLELNYYLNKDSNQSY